MSFTDDLKRSLGFEETESTNKENGLGLTEMIREILKPVEDKISQQRNSQQQYGPNVQQQYNQQQYRSDAQQQYNQQQYRPDAQQQYNQQQYEPNAQQQEVPNHKTAPNPTHRQAPRPTPVYDDPDDYVIIPDQSFYEIVLIRPKTIDDINYVVDQVIGEQNPVILDLSFLEKESSANFKLAGDKIKQMRANYGAQALLLSRSEDKNLIIITPRKVRVVNKG